MNTHEIIIRNKEEVDQFISLSNDDRKKYLEVKKIELFEMLNGTRSYVAGMQDNLLLNSKDNEENCASSINKMIFKIECDERKKYNIEKQLFDTFQQINCFSRFQTQENLKNAIDILLKMNPFQIDVISKLVFS